MFGINGGTISILFLFLKSCLLDLTEYKHIVIEREEKRLQNERAKKKVLVLALKFLYRAFQRLWFDHTFSSRYVRIVLTILILTLRFL